MSQVSRKNGVEKTTRRRRGENGEETTCLDLPRDVPSSAIRRRMGFLSVVVVVVLIELAIIIAGPGWPRLELQESSKGPWPSNRNVEGFLLLFIHLYLFCRQFGAISKKKDSLVKLDDAEWISVF